MFLHRLIQTKVGACKGTQFLGKAPRMFFTSQFDNNNASMFIEDDEEEQDDYFTQKIKKDDSDEFSDLDSDDGFWSDEDPVPTQQATQIPESDKLTMMIEERFSTQNSVNFDRKYADRLRVFVKGGQGGNGCAALFRSNYGHILPNGGDGGNGGNVYFSAHSYLSNLYQLKRAHFFGNKGQHGLGKCRHGKDGNDVMHTVPIGTEIYKIIRADPDTTNRDRNKEHKILIADLDKEGKKFLVCRGGNGGRGNFNHRDIVATEIGQKGEELEIELVLKTLADVGLVGFPNAGKSTFLASVSRAFPKIAPYPFTTIRPYVGNCKFVDGKAMTIADLPGLIEGAHANKGLGHEFLRHIERTKVILYVIDGTGDDERRPINDYKILRRELELYNPEMSNVKSLIVVNKCDRQHTSYREKFEELRQVAHTRIIPMSAKMSINIEDVILALRGLVMNETKEETLKLMSEANIDQTYL